MSILLPEPRVRRPRHRESRPRLELRCRDCGYGVVVARAPARCPMCGGPSWRRTGYRRYEEAAR